MRHNSRPALKASKLNPSDITLHPGEPVTVVCPDCRTWRKLTRSMIPAHRSTDLGRSLRDDEGKQFMRDTRCPGSGQRVQVDITSAQWTQRMKDANTDAAGRRATKVLIGKVLPPVQPATTQMQAAGARFRLALQDHQARGCRACSSGRPCDAAYQLRRQARLAAAGAAELTPAQQKYWNENRSTASAPTRRAA